VPRLHFRTGAVRSQIGNSPEILRYLWGAYGVSRGAAAAFLEPSAERLEFERRIDRCGVSLQVWIYYHLLDAPALCKHAWGADSQVIPAWQRKLVDALFPVQAFMIRKAFRVNEAHYRKSCEHIEALLADVEGRLADGRRSILGGDARSCPRAGAARGPADTRARGLGTPVRRPRTGRAASTRS
jgi:hypothetical protein